MMRRLFSVSLYCLFVLLLCLAGTAKASAESLHIAVASNFLPVIQLLKPHFEKNTGHELILSSASSGKLYAQIINGAPYDVFLSADQARPLKLIDEGRADRNSLIPYAYGQLILVSHIPVSSEQCIDALDSPRFRHLAIANPRTAPYGLAAQQTLEKLNRWQSLKGQLIRGENIAQTFHFFSRKAVQLALISSSQQHQAGVIACHWLVPAEYHEPIIQSAVILANTKRADTAKAFLDFLQSPQAKVLIRSNGYLAGEGL